jgi:predicted amidohydrolase
MKIALVQQNYHIGNFEYNTEKIIQGIQMAKQGARTGRFFRNVGMRIPAP